MNCSNFSVIKAILVCSNFFSHFYVTVLVQTTISGMLNDISHVMRRPVVPYANNKGADQPAHLRSLISTFVSLLR